MWKEERHPSVSGLRCHSANTFLARLDTKECRKCPLEQTCQLPLVQELLFPLGHRSCRPTLTASVSALPKREIRHPCHGEEGRKKKKRDSECFNPTGPSEPKHNPAEHNTRHRSTYPSTHAVTPEDQGQEERKKSKKKQTK